jgi:hypothetical protein
MQSASADGLTAGDPKIWGIWYVLIFVVFLIVFCETEH